jgi:hypothetical protein
VFDPVSGRTEELGRARSAQLAPAGGALFLERAEGAVVRSSDGRERPLPGRISQVGFIGGTLLYLETSEKKLMRLGPDEEMPQQLASDMASWMALPGGALTVLVARKTTDSAEFYLLDVASGAGRLIGRGGTASELFVAPDGQRVVIDEPIKGTNQIRVRVIALEDGQERSVDLAVPPQIGRGGPIDPTLDLPPATSVAFRPRSAEIWFFVNGRLYVLGDAVTFVDRRVEPVRRIGKSGAGTSTTRTGSESVLLRVERSAIFTSDGVHWLFRGSDDKTRLGPADRPAEEEGVVLAGQVFFDEGDIIELRPGGPIVFEDGPPGGGRRDLYVVEPPWQSRRLLARDVAQVLFGAERALAIVRPIGARVGEQRSGVGELVLLDLASGTETPLARNVVTMALGPCSGCDVVAPGRTLSYVVQARVPYRFDGLWRGALP